MNVLKPGKDQHVQNFTENPIINTTNLNIIRILCDERSNIAPTSCCHETNNNANERLSWRSLSTSEIRTKFKQQCLKTPSTAAQNSYEKFPMVKSGWQCPKTPEKSIFCTFCHSAMSASFKPWRWVTWLLLLLLLCLVPAFGLQQRSKIFEVFFFKNVYFLYIFCEGLQWWKKTGKYLKFMPEK